ncbi:unnamed protein product [Schistosoma mattheei]|uniref:Uncharacterized protein n=1 Tax=Schistosoma mattheei TaxID=31246 RepID=A0A183P263_9TREM|nr:unnamed protein product [Schistosoma mattheei]
MEPVIKLLDIHSDFDSLEDYFEKFEIWAMTKEDDEDVNIVAHFLTFIGREAYSLLKTLALPLPYTALKELLLDYVKYTNVECGQGGRYRKMIHDDIKNSTTLRHHNPVHTQGYAYSNQPTYQISHVIVPDMAFPNDSHISDEIPYKSAGNMLNEPSHDRKN